jgi:hypothetical protein
MPLFLLFALVGWNVRASSSDQPDYKRVGVCDVLAPASHMQGELVEIEAEVHNAIPHGLYLVDQRCPKRSLQLDYQLKDADPSLSNFHRLIFNDVLEARGKFRGRVERDSKTGRLYLLLRSVLDVQPVKSPSPDTDKKPNAETETSLHESGHLLAASKP